MALELLALFGGALVLVFYADGGRVPFITRFRYPLTGLGFLCFAGSSYLATTRDVPRGWGFDSASVAFVLAGSVSLVRIVLSERQRSADPAYNPEAAATWYAEGQNHLRIFLARDDLAALDRAVELFRQSVDATARHSSRLTHLTALLTALQARYELQRRLDDLDEAIDYGRTASGSGGGVRRGLVLSMLSTALRMRYDSVGAAGDLADAHEASRTAIRLVPFSSRHYPRCSSEFAALHRAEHERTQQQRSLDLAIEHVRKSLRSARVLGSARRVDLTTLCALLAERGRRTKNMRDLDDAVDTGRQALRIVRPDDQLFQPCQNNLALALRARFGLRPAPPTWTRRSASRTARPRRFPRPPRSGRTTSSTSLWHCTTGTGTNSATRPTASTPGRAGRSTGRSRPHAMPRTTTSPTSPRGSGPGSPGATSPPRPAGTARR